MPSLLIPAPAVEVAPVIPTADPRESWPRWTDQRWTTTEPADEPRPTPGPDYDPSPWDQAEWLGHSLAASGEDPEPPAELISRGALQAFYRGRLDGEIAVERHRIMSGWGGLDPCADFEPRDSDGFAPGYTS